MQELLLKVATFSAIFALSGVCVLAAPPRCELILQPRYLSQLDRRLEEAGLWYNGRSELCGPVCILNWLNTRLARRGEIGPDPILAIELIIEYMERWYALNHIANDPRVGTNMEVMVETTRAVLARVGIDLDIQGKMVFSGGYGDEPEAPITWGDFHRVAGSGQPSLIIVQGGPRDQDTLGYGASYIYQPRLAHWMMVVDFYPQTQTLALIDPFKPEIPLFGKLTELGGRTFNIEFNRPLLSELSDFVYIINGQITFRTKTQ